MKQWIIFHNKKTYFIASPSVEQYRSQFIKEGLRIKLAKDKSGRCEEAKVSLSVEIRSL